MIRFPGRFQAADFLASWLTAGAPKRDRDRAAEGDQALAELAAILELDDVSWRAAIVSVRGVVAHRDAACRGLELAQLGLAAAVERPLSVCEPAEAG